MHCFHLLLSVCNLTIVVLCFSDCMPSVSVFAIADNICLARTELVMSWKAFVIIITMTTITITNIIIHFYYYYC